PVPELRHGGRLDRRRLPEAEVLGGAVRGARPARARGGRAVRRLRGPRPEPGRAARDPGCRVRGARVGRGAPAGGRRARARGGRVNGVTAALVDPQTEARGAVVEIEHPRLGRVRQPASPLRLGDDPPLERAPFRGEHTEAVLAELCGYAPERLAGLAVAGVFG